MKTSSYSAVQAWWGGLSGRLRTWRRLSGPLLLCCFLIAFPGVLSALAAGPQPLSGPFTVDGKEIADARESQWNIEAETLSYDEKRELFEAEGNVRISSRDRMIEADRATLDMVKRQADLWGNVTLRYGKNWLKGEHVTWGLDSETGWLENGIVFFAENNFFVQGRSISKTGPTQFELKEGFLTSCNPADPDWKIQYQSMKVDVGGTAWARDISMWARGVPIAYLPIIGVPVEKERQSGLLIPWAGYSDVTGYDFEAPYYWAIRDDMDATFYARYLSERGFMGGAEYRVNNRQWGEGVWMFNFLDDQASKTFLDDKGYPFQSDERFWARVRHNVELPWKVDAKIDIDLVSDRNFLQEFSRGSSSYVYSETAFRDHFGRGILYDGTSLVRESSIYLEKRRESDLLSMDVRYFQQLQDNLENVTIQRLPSFSYSILPTYLKDTPLYYSLESSAINYWRSEGDREQKLDFRPRAFYPMHWGNYLDIEPSAGFRSTTYLVEWENRNFDDLNQRAIGDARVEMSSRLNRVYPVSLGEIVAIQHAIRPEIAYEYATQGIMGHTPHLDRLDEDQSRNGMRYGFTTFLTAKEVVKDAQGNPVTSYRELARFRAFQFFNVERPFVEDPLFNTRALDEGMSPLGLRLDIMPKKYITLSYDADYDWQSTGEGNSHDVYMTLDSGKGHILRVDYQKRHDLPVDEITTEVLVKTLPNLYVNAYHDYSLDQGELFKHGYGFKYFRGCWGIGVAYEREGDDNRVLISLDLLGLGSYGSTALMGRPRYAEATPDFQRPETYKAAK
ncbi:MAG: LPS assembly protein LptD [Syntrophobacteraceae bacterium]